MERKRQADEVDGRTYARSCPYCGEIQPSSKMALRCWYKHDPELVSSLTITQIADELGVSFHTARRGWKYLVDHFDAPSRTGGGEIDPGHTYDRVVDYMKRRRRSKKGLIRGWTVSLSETCGVTRQRISQLADKARVRGDLS